MFGRVRSGNARRRIGKRAGVIAALTMATTIAAGSLTVVPAIADDPVQFPVSFTVTGSSVVKKTNSTVQLGPGNLDGNIIVNGDSIGIAGDLSLPPSEADISLVSGIFKIKATLQVVPIGQVAGTISNGDLITHAKVDMVISDISVGLLVPIIPLPTIPASCKTVTPVDLTLVTKDVDLFAPTITSTGTYTIPAFGGCLIANLALGALVSGPDNTISMTLTSNQ
jgi:hypothetical protein